MQQANNRVRPTALSVLLSADLSRRYSSDAEWKHTTPQSQRCMCDSCLFDILVAIISLVDIRVSPSATTEEASNTKRTMSDDEDDYLAHPDAAIRLASAVHRFRVPVIDPDQKLSFAKSFKTTGTHPKTKNLMLKVRHR